MPIVPYQVLVLQPVQNDIIILCVPFVGTARHQGRLSQQLRIHGGWGDVVPHGAAGFVEVDRGVNLGDGLAQEFDLEGSRGEKGVYPFEGVFRVDIDWRVFLKPLI